MTTILEKMDAKKFAKSPREPSKSKSNNAIAHRFSKLDPARALEPARKKLTTIESQRIMAVFDEAIKKAQLVAALPYMTESLDKYKHALGIELCELFKMHCRTTMAYQEIRKTLDDLLDKRAKIIARHKREQSEEEESIVSSNHTQAKEQERRGYSFSSLGDTEETTDDGQGTTSAFDPTATEPSIIEPQEDSIALSERKSVVIEEKQEEQVSEHVDQMVKHKKSSSKALSKHSYSSSISDLEPRIKEVMRNLGLVAQQVSNSCKNILRHFMANPTAMKLILTDVVIRSAGAKKFLECLMELRDILMNKLLTTPEEEKERMSYLEDISRRERHNAAIIAKQEAELSQAVAEKDNEIEKKNAVIKRLQTELHQIEKFSDENIRRTRAEAEKQEIADAKNSDQKTQKLQQEIGHMQSQLNATITEHREIEAELRAKKYKVETEVENWIQKYDQDLGERQDEFEEIELIYTEEKKQLFELEERFANLEKEYNAIMDERRYLREKRERAQRELALFVKAATTIQAFWRSYKVRKALKAKYKKKGKKK